MIECEITEVSLIKIYQVSNAMQAPGTRDDLGSHGVSITIFSFRGRNVHQIIWYLLPNLFAILL